MVPRIFAGLMAGLLVLTMTGCDQIDPNSPLGKRKAIFQQMLEVKEDMGGMLRERLPFDPAAFREEAEQLDALSQQPWQYYPAVKESRSAARDAVWERQAQFKALTDELLQATTRLQQKAQTQPLTANGIREAFMAVEQACEKCHENFRAY